MFRKIIKLYFQLAYMCYAFIKKVEKIDVDSKYLLYSTSMTVAYILIFNLATLIYLLELFEFISTNLQIHIIIAVLFIIINSFIITYDKIYKYKFTITKKHIAFFIFYIIISLSLLILVLNKSRKNNFYKKEYKKEIRKTKKSWGSSFYVFFKDKTKLSLDIDKLINQNDTISFDKYIKKGDSFIKKRNSFKIIIKSKKGEKEFIRNF